MDLNSYSGEQAKAFTANWLPAWTGNQAEKLASFYTEDAYYSDPVIPAGVTGRRDLTEYFQKLLKKNPNWIWTHKRSIPMQDGFLNYWIAKIPTKSELVTCEGVCVVQLRDGLIYRNEVFFDRSALLSIFQQKE